MDFNDDIGCFGLPINSSARARASSSSSSRPKSKLKSSGSGKHKAKPKGAAPATTKMKSNKKDAAAAAKKRPALKSGKKRPLPPSNLAGQSSSDSSDDDDDEKEMSLAQLAHANNTNTKTPSDDAAATVTPGPTSSASVSAAASTTANGSTDDAPINKKPRGFFKPTKKQLGLRSFLTKSDNNKAANEKLEEQLSSEKSSEGKPSSSGESATKPSSSSSSSSSANNRKRPHSFISAAELMNNDESVAKKSAQNSNGHVRNGTNQQTLQPTQQERPSVNQNGKAVHDELEEFSDDEENAKLPGKEPVDEKHDGLEVEIDSSDQESTKSSRNTESKQEDRQSKMRRSYNTAKFGIHKCIMGHALSTMHREETNGTIDTSINLTHVARDVDDDPSYQQEHPHEQHETKLLHGKSGISITSQLFQRSILSTTPRLHSKLQQFAHSGKHWNVCPTVQLATATDDNGDGSRKNNGEVCAMEFDREGVLLATGDDRGFVRIYDFDDVYAADVRKRNEAERFMPRVQEEEEDGMDDGEDEAVAAQHASGDLNNEGDSNNEPQQHAMNAEATDDSGSEAGDSKNNAAPLVPPSVARPVLSFQCRARPGGNVGPRISGVVWNPSNQDQLVVSFANQQELHIYDIGSEQTPLPCLRLGDSRQSRSEGILKALFLPLQSKSSSTQILTGGNYGTVRLWMIPKPQPRKGAPPSIGSLNAKCMWSIAAFGSNGEGVCDMLTLSSEPRTNNEIAEPTTTTSSLPNKKPLVLLAGNGSSLALLDTNKITRKAFSTSVTPTIAASWDLYNLALRELSKADVAGAKLPARRWMAAHRLSLISHECTTGSDHMVSWFKIGIVVKCGWVFVAEISISSSPVGGGTGNTNNQTQGSNNLTKLRLHLVYRTPRIQCFNSAEERLTTIGGMGLHFSLPDTPIPSSDNQYSMRGMVWLGDVRIKRYTLPSKDKYVLSEKHGTVSSEISSEKLRHPGNGLILAHIDRFFKSMSSAGAVAQDEAGVEANHTPSIIRARLPLSRGCPLSLTVHPSGEWMVIGYGMNGRGATTKPLELVCMRKSNVPC